MKQKLFYLKFKKSLFFILFFTIIFSFENLWAKQKVKYQAYFDQCPSRTAGTLILNLIKTFENDLSLGNLKKRLLNEKLLEKHFVSDYQIDFDPTKKFLKFKLECPTPLMKVQVYKKNSSESYDAILVENGQLFDPTYEVLLKAEKKLIQDLPYLALPVKELKKERQVYMAQIINDIPITFRQKLSEIIINNAEELTIILSVDGNPSSVFLGDQDWEEKIKKLQRIVNFMKEKKKVPTIINLTNSDKVVVKFNGKF